MSREVELGCESWTSFASSYPSCSSTAVQRTLSLWLCPAQQLKQQLPSAQVAGQCRGDTALNKIINTSIVLAAVHGLSGLFRAVSAVEPSLCRPLPPLSPSLISHLASVDVLKQHWRRRRSQCMISLSPPLPPTPPIPPSDPPPPPLVFPVPNNPCCFFGR